jgi:hypothetical protein
VFVVVAGDLAYLVETIVLDGHDSRPIRLFTMTRQLAGLLRRASVICTRGVIGDLQAH